MSCGSIKSIASLLCAACLWAQVGTTELDFGKIAKQDKAVNDFSHNGIDLVFSTTSTGLTLSASPGDLMIDFAHIYQIEHPTPPIQFYSHGESV
jgi:hypothetical protein